MTRRKLAALFVPLAAIAAVAVVAAATAATPKPIVIGWAFDSKGAMAPFDNPALAAANVRVGQINARGGIKGRQLDFFVAKKVHYTAFDRRNHIKRVTVFRGGERCKSLGQRVAARLGDG